ncbi:MAG: polysaccharide biosynthesis/export family protein [Desulfobaccales bacterium]
MTRFVSQVNRQWLMGSVALMFALALFCSCTPHVSPVTEGQAAVATAATPDQDKYLLGPEDAIEISVWKEPDLTKQLVVRPDGKITYPLIGEVQASGQTVKQLQAEILKRLEKFVTDAHVTVILLKAQNYKIYVTGKAMRPGEFVVGKPVNVMQAIAMAGGLTPFASPGSIMVLRTVAGQEMIYPFNYKEVAKGQFLEQNRILLPGDVVVVP